MSGDIVTVGRARVKTAAEYLVLSRLLQRGYNAALIPNSANEPAIMVPLGDMGQHHRIEVVSSFQGQSRGWHVTRSNYNGDVLSFFYALVDFNEKSSQVYVLPAELVEKVFEGVHESDPTAPHPLMGQKYRVSNKMPGMTPGWMDGFLESWSFFEPIVVCG